MNASNPIHSHGNRKPPSHTVRVRMGTQTWTVPDRGTASEEDEPVLRIERRRAPITLTAMRARIEEARSPSTSRSRLNRAVAAMREWILPPGEGRFQAGLKTGLASGMMLGSLALVGFHQLAAPVAHVPAIRTEARGSSTGVVASPSTPVAYPGLFIEVAIPLRSSGGSAWLALTPVGIRHVLQTARLRPGDYEIQAVRLRAGAAMLPGVLPQAAVNQDENALALAESALLAAVSWAADGGRQEDAERALANALAIPPTTWSGWPNGEGRFGTDLYQALQGMRTSVHQGAARRCESQAVRALNDWLHLCGWPGLVELSKMSH
ncbi:hypothetical protein [Alicyclobacillus acidocaldarius]|uniref:hypothetical protein n=1 Tax=Alicyclobacillus acidocaldarius TaxID=405212 RepID=UPI00345E974D